MSQPLSADSPRRRRRYVALAIVLLLAAVALGWKLWPRPAPAQPPALDPTGVDPVVWRALETAREQVRRAPHSSGPWGRLGMILLAHQFRAEAGPCLARAEQLDPHDVRWPYYQALAVRRSDPEAATSHLRRALVVGGDDYEGPRLLLGELLTQGGQWDEAETLFRACWQRDPHNSRAALGLARCAAERDDLSGSLAHLRGATDDPRTQKAAHLLLAEVQQRRGDRAAAEQALREARHLPDDLPWPDVLTEALRELIVGHLEVITRAAALLQRDRAPEAIALLRQAVEDYPESSWARVLLGRAYLRAGDLTAAEQVLRATVERAADSVEAQFYLGVVLFEQDKYAAAVPYFREATRLKPDYALAWYNLGHALKRQGDRAGAVAAFRAAVSCKPQFAEARTNLGELLAEEGQFDAAVEQLRLAPDNARAKRLLESVRKRGTSKP